MMVRSLAETLAQTALAAERGADLVELRVEQFTHAPDELIELLDQCPLPCILTCRPTWEGGHYEGDEATRAAFLQHVLLGERGEGDGVTRPPVYIDVELLAYQRSPEMRDLIARIVDHPAQEHPARVGLILSSHDFEQRPADLLQRVEAMLEAPECRVMKIVWQARSLRNNLEAFEVLRASYKPTIALCMGEFGLASRVLAKKFGALLTFAGLDDDTGTAPGQVGVATMKQLYRWDAIDRDTQVFGVIGWPVAHSKSPQIHNAGFDAVGHNGVYLPLPIPPEWEHFKATVGEWVADENLDFQGASVTIPHKAHLLQFVREQGGEIDELADRIGAANTLARRPNGSLFATNTDYGAALDAVCDAMQIEREDLAGKRVAVIGAGGVARAIVAGFAHYGATVVVYNRTASRAEELAKAFNGKTGKVVAAPMSKLCDTCCEIYINCTPIGMHPDVDASPMETLPKQTTSQTVVFDTIYNPTETKLLRQAKEAGCVTVGGIEMFNRQAAAQFELWTGKQAPAEVFNVGR